MLFAIPSAFIAAFILDQIKSLDIYSDMVRQTQKWELFVVAIAIVEAVILTASALILSRLNRPKGMES